MIPLYRWVSSHKVALDRLYKNYKPIVLHLNKIEQNPRDFGQGASDQAKEMKPFFMSSCTLIIIMLQIDVMLHFEKQSLVYQNKDQSIIGNNLLCFT